MIEYENELDSILPNSAETKPKNYISILKEKVFSIHHFNKIQTGVLNRFFNKVTWIGGSLICGGLFSVIHNLVINGEKAETNVLFSIILSAGGAIMLTPFILLALLGITYFIVSRSKSSFWDDTIYYFSKEYKKASEQGESNEIELYKLLEDPFVQHEIITYLQNLESSGYEKYVKSDLESLIKFLSKKYYKDASNLVIRNLPYWMDFEQQLIKKNTKDTTKEDFLKDLNSYVNNHSVENEMSKKINYDLKSML